MLDNLFSMGALAAFFQVVMIDLVLTGDNAVAIGLAAAGLPTDQRRKAIALGLVAALVTRIIFALITVQLLAQVGLLLAGGFLLVWVCWKMWQELRAQGREATAEAEQALEDASGIEMDAHPAHAARPKTMWQALVQILVADITMSLDNVLAVAGATREHPEMLALGLILSIALVGVAATWIASVLHRFRWLGYVGLIIVAGVAGRMIWEGHRQVLIDVHQVAAYNQLMPDFVDIGPAEVIEHTSHRTGH